MSLREHVQNASKPEGQEGFELLDRMNTGEHELLSNWCLETLTAYIQNEAEGFTPAHTLDIGCGGGANLMRLHTLFADTHLEGIDYSEVSVAKSKETLVELINAGTCDVSQGSVEKLPYENASINLATAFETVYFWSEIQSSMKEVQRTIAEGGLFLIGNETDGREKNLDDYNEVNDLMHIYSEDELIKLLNEAGFKKVTSRYNNENHWLCIIAQN